MRHGIVGKNLSRKTAHLVALRRNMASSLFEHGQITTTLAKARHVQPFAEKLITLARRGTLHARRLVIARLQDRDLIDPKNDTFVGTAVRKLFDEVAPKYADRLGGYTRIIRTARRRIGDGGELAILQLVDPAEPVRKKPTNLTPRRKQARARYALAEKRSARGTARTQESQEQEQADQAAADQAAAPEQTEQPSAQQGPSAEQAAPPTGQGAKP